MGENPRNILKVTTLLAERLCDWTVGWTLWWVICMVCQLYFSKVISLIKRKKNSLIGWRAGWGGCGWKAYLRPHCLIPSSVTRRKKTGWIFVHSYQTLPPPAPHCAVLPDRLPMQCRAEIPRTFNLRIRGLLDLLADVAISQKTLLHSSATNPSLGLPTFPR